MRSWLRDTFRLYLQYLAVGFVFLPFAVAYVLIRKNTQAGCVIPLMVLFSALPVGFLIWSVLGRFWKTQRIDNQHPPVSPWVRAE